MSEYECICIAGGPMFYRHMHERHCPLSVAPKSKERCEIDSLKQRIERLEGALEHGELWSFFRRLLSQGGDIQMDYNAGKYRSYEHYAARLDAAARERADEFLQALADEPGKKEAS